jgi:hypothetical protein
MDWAAGGTVRVRRLGNAGIPAAVRFQGSGQLPGSSGCRRVCLGGGEGAGVPTAASRPRLALPLAVRPDEAGGRQPGRVGRRRGGDPVDWPGRISKVDLRAGPVDLFRVHGGASGIRPDDGGRAQTPSDARRTEADADLRRGRCRRTVVARDPSEPGAALRSGRIRGRRWEEEGAFDSGNEGPGVRAGPGSDCGTPRSGPGVDRHSLGVGGGR